MVKQLYSQKEKVLAWLGFMSVIFFLIFLLLPALVNNDLRIVHNGNSEIERIVHTGEDTLLPVEWGDLGKQMVENGVIDGARFENLYTATYGGLTEDGMSMLYGSENDNIVITSGNSHFVLNLLWAFGLTNKNIILESSEMRDPDYGNGAYFASVGGWTLLNGSVMDHYGAHEMLTLSNDQQELVERVAQNIYRPCCDNSVMLPDCNHGMAMLGLLELLASEGVGESEIYDIALGVNTYWFPDHYRVISTYLREQGLSGADSESKNLLSSAYSSGTGYRRILSRTGNAPEGGASCNV
ncbi:MAG: hypothetical protein Q8Q18_02750 [bacterium]|nr:hypothetical protein [bacterium]